MTRLTLALVSGLAALVVGCGDGDSNGGLLGPLDQAALAASEEKWDERPFADYVFETRRFCFCPFEITQWARVTVRSGAIVRVERVASGTVVPVDQHQFWWTIEELFEEIRQAAKSAVFSTIEVRYDSALGFPIRIELLEKPIVADANATIDVRAVGPAS